MSETRQAPMRRTPVGRPGRPPRLFFSRTGGLSAPLLGAGESVDQLRDGARFTSTNVGNLVHREAPAQLLRYDRDVVMRPVDRSPAAMERAYDGIVLGYPNMIRRYDHLDAAAVDEAMAQWVREHDWLSQMRCPFYAFGVGIQDVLPPHADAVDPRLFALLKLLNDRAEIFAVRGETTAAWLHAVGLTNAVALGCPSLFVYPRNMMAVRPPPQDRALRIATAGRIQPSGRSARLNAANRIGAAFDSSYVFQDDLFALFRDGTDTVIYDDATGEVAADAVRARAHEMLQAGLAFGDYRFFRSTEKWRGFTIGKDAYFGDRFHGGVVFLQCGKPALIIRNDARVDEMTALCGIPNATVDEVLNNDPVALLRERLSDEALRRFRATYLERYRAFRSALHAVGLEQYHPIDPDLLAHMV